MDFFLCCQLLAELEEIFYKIKRVFLITGGRMIIIKKTAAKGAAAFKWRKNQNANLHLPMPNHESIIPDGFRSGR